MTRKADEQRAFSLTRVDDETSSPVTLDLQSRRLELGAGEQGVIGVKLTVNAAQPLALGSARTRRGKDSNQTQACVKACVKVKLAVTPLAPVAPGGDGAQAEAVPDQVDLVELLVYLPELPCNLP